MQFLPTTALVDYQGIAIKKMKTNERTGFVAVIVRELRRMISRPLYFVVTLILPLLSFGIFWAIFHQGVPRDLPVAVYDADHSALSRRIIRMIDATSTIKVAYKVSDIGTGRKLILATKSYALIILPKDLERDVYSGKAPHIIEYYNNELLLPGSLINRDVRRVVGTVSAGADLRIRQKRSEMTEAAMAHLEPIKIESHILFNPYINFLYFLVSALLPTMLHIFVLTVSVFAIGVELKDGTAKEWLICAGGSTWRAVAAKLFPYTVIFVVLGLFMNSFLFRYLGVPLRGSSLLIMIATLLMILAYQAIGLLFVTVTANLRLALSFAAFYSSTAFAFVGITFPTMAMPLPGKIWGGILPLSYYLKIFVDQSIRGAAISASIPAMIALIVFLFVVPIVPIWRFRKLMCDKRYWGRI